MADEIYLTDEDSETGAASAHDPKKAPSLLNDVALYRTLKQWFLMDDGHSAEWRTRAKSNFDFAAGDQWEEKTRKTLDTENRVPLTFNYVLSFIKAVAGLEIGSRHETVYLPRNIEEGDIKANETLSEVSKQMGDECDAEDEQSEAFMDTLICGMGWTESRMDFESDKDGSYIEEKLDPLEMRWDRSARKKNLQDARRVWRVRTMTLDEAKALFPDADDSDLNASWAIGYDTDGEPKSIEERRLKLENSVENDPKSEVHIVQCQWWERECFYRVAFQDKEEELSEDAHKKLMKDAKEAGVGDQLVSAKQYRRKYKQAFIGGVILECGDCPDPERFTLQCITGQPHKSKGTWFGLVEIMRDPAMNANKWMSQALHILNTTAKGGIIAERGSFKNIAEAQKTYARPDAITIVEDGAIQKGRIMQKPGVGLAAPYIQMMQFAIQAIPDVTGINLELLGLVDRDQPGILEAQRKQAGMTILATLLDSLRRYRKNVGRIRLYFIQNYMPEGKIIRITGPDGYKGMRLIKDDKMMGDYDVIVSDAPTSPNSKEATWTMIMQLSQLPSFQQILTPEVTAQMLEYCPLPSKIVQLLKDGLAKPNPQRDQQQQLAIADAVANIKKTQTESDRNTAGAGLDRARTVLALADAGAKRAQTSSERMGQNMVKGRMGPRFGALVPPQPDQPDIIAPQQGMGGPPMPPQLPLEAPRPGMRAQDLVSMIENARAQQTNGQSA